MQPTSSSVLTQSTRRGRDGDELMDYSYNPTKPRRRSNSFSTDHKLIKSKFEANDQEIVFEEELHGPETSLDASEEGYDLEKESTHSSAGSGSIDEEDMAYEKK